jgi:hypothetical protein
MVCLIVLLVLLVITSLNYFIFEPSTLKWLASEDGPLENLSAINWLLAAAIMFILFAKKKNIWFLLLGIFFFVCLGEEISWGQRLLGFATPEAIRGENLQGEFNLHNMNFFDRRFGQKSFWDVMYDMTRLFAIFWFLYGCVLPVAMKLSSRLDRFVQKIRLPVMPLYIGVLFLVNYAVFQYFEDFHRSVCAYVGIVNTANSSSLPVETREWFESLLFLVFTLGAAAQNLLAPASEKIYRQEHVAAASLRPALEPLRLGRRLTVNRQQSSVTSEQSTTDRESGDRYNLPAAERTSPRFP